LSQAENLLGKWQQQKLWKLNDKWRRARQRASQKNIQEVYDKVEENGKTSALEQEEQ